MDKDKADAICASIAEGESLRAACVEHGVSTTTFLRWADGDSAIADQYARARATGADVEFERLQDIADEQPERGPTGTVDPGWVAWQRGRIDTRKWTLARKAPRKYGEKIETTHQVGDSVTKVIREIVYPPK